MNKRQLFEAMWIPLEKRRPPNTKTLFLGWNDQIKGPILASGIEINKAWEFKDSGYQHLLHNTYFNITKWMPVYGG